MKTDVLGVAFDALTLTEAEERADALLRARKGGYIVTANPEIVLHSRDDAAYAAAVNGADLVLADGVGDLYAARILGTPLPERVAGSDLTPRLLSRLAERGGSVFLYGARPGVAERAGEALRSACPGLRIAGTENGYISDETALFAALEQEKPDLLLLDIMLPEEDGMQVLAKLRSNPEYVGLPVIMLTAKGSEYDKVIGLDSGADDYVAKPFGTMELISRIKALLRRTSSQETKEYDFGGLYVNTSKHIVRVNGSEVQLTFKEFELLCYLLENMGTVLSREKIISKVWGYDFDGESRTVDVHIRTLRMKLGDCGGMIETVRGIGYKAVDIA